MTTEELLLDRFKVATTWPDMSNYEMYQGQIIKLVKLNSGGFGHPTKGNTFYKSFFENYPHLFWPLPWYAERELADMPMFVRYSEYYLNHYHLDGEFKEKIFKVDKWEKGHYGVKATGEEIIHGYEMNFIPASRAEYEWKQSNK